MNTHTYSQVGDFLRQIFVTLFAIASVFLLTPQPEASAEPAIRTGSFQNCAAKYPGSFLDVGLGECWVCPDTYPSRTVFDVAGPKACERAATVKYKKALGPQNPTGLLKTDCARGYFLDIGLGKCYSCPSGYARSTKPVNGSQGCFQNVSAAYSKGAKQGEPCPDGSFRHALTKSCYACPSGSYRNANMGADPSQFNACMACGKEDQKACPVTTLRKSCDEGLQEVAGVCRVTQQEILRRHAVQSFEGISPYIVELIKTTLSLESDSSFRDGIQSKSTVSTASAKQKLQADINPCLWNEYNTWTVGTATTGGAIVQGSVESGVAIDISVPGRTGSQRPMYAYGGWSGNVSLGGGLTSGLTYGCWIDQNNALSGNYHGITLDLATLYKNYMGTNSLKPSTGKGLAVGMWYSNDGRNRFLGFTITVTYGYSADALGYSYSKGETGQITGAFPPPIFGDKVVERQFYTFVNDPSRRNEFIMQGPNQFQVRSAPKGGSPGAFHVYTRKFGSPNVFTAKDGAGDYTINSDGTLTWKGGSTVIHLRPSS